MNHKLIARIVVPLKDGSFSFGTAYPISNTLVITARHVLQVSEIADEGNGTLHWFDTVKGELVLHHEQSFSFQDIVYGVNEDQYDVALIRCDIPKEKLAIDTFLSARFPEPNKNWAGGGYPWLDGANTGDAVSRQPVIGKVTGPIDNDIKQLVTCEPDASEKELWQGISGGPVIVDGMLCGIITTTKRVREKSFCVVDLPYVVNHCEEFRKWVNPQSDKTGIKNIYTFLKKYPELVRAISVPSDDTGPSKLNAVSSHLCGLNIPDFLDCILGLQEENPELIDLSKSLIKVCLPTLFIKSEVLNLEEFAQPLGRIIQVPLATGVSVEMLMAANDMRAADIALIPISDVGRQIHRMTAGTYNLSFGPEVGDKGNNQMLNNLGSDLKNRILPDVDGDIVDEDFGVLVDDSLFNRFVGVSPNAKSRDDKKDLLNDMLETWSTRKRNRKTYYWLLDINYDDIKGEEMKRKLANKFERLAAEVGSHLPALKVIKLYPNFEAEKKERRKFDQLEDALAARE